MDPESRWYRMFKRLDQNKNHPSRTVTWSLQAGGLGESFAGVAQARTPTYWEKGAMVGGLLVGRGQGGKEGMKEASRGLRRQTGCEGGMQGVKEASRG